MDFPETVPFDAAVVVVSALFRLLQRAGWGDAGVAELQNSLAGWQLFEFPETARARGDGELLMLVPVMVLLLLLLLFLVFLPLLGHFRCI